MICVTNRIPVAEGYEIDFEDRFRKRVHLVDQAKGFIRNEVHRPRPMKLDHQSGTSPSFAEAHRSRPPKEMFRGPNELTIHEVFLNTDHAETL
jgi:heme-degrading monooxygenase HmoA